MLPNFFGQLRHLDLRPTPPTSLGPKVIPAVFLFQCVTVFLVPFDFVNVPIAPTIVCGN
jgi:hypothetical protein